MFSQADMCRRRLKAALIALFGGPSLRLPITYYNPQYLQAILDNQRGESMAREEVSGQDEYRSSN
jgi:hypothetical protein